MPSTSSASLLQTYWQFLRFPTLVQPQSKLSNSRIFGHLLQLYSLHILIVLGLGIVISQLVETEDNQLIETFEGFSGGLIILTGVILVPILEEVLFRLPLKGTIPSLLLSGCIWLWILLSFSTQNNFGVLVILGCILVSITLWLRFKSWTRLNAKIQSFYRHYPRWIFYGLTIAFGVIHIMNYDSKVWHLLPILVLPQVIAGLWFGFMRLQYGFKWAVISHGFYNGTLLLPFALINILGSDALQSQGLEKLDPQTLPLSDQILTGLISLYFLGGIVICAVSVFRLIRGKSKVL